MRDEQPYGARRLVEISLTQTPGVEHVRLLATVVYGYCRLLRLFEKLGRNLFLLEIAMENRLLHQEKRLQQVYRLIAVRYRHEGLIESALGCVLGIPRHGLDPCPDRVRIRFEDLRPGCRNFFQNNINFITDFLSVWPEKS